MGGRDSRLPVSTGDHLVAWLLDDATVHGVISLEPGRVPRGTLQLEPPTVRQGSRSFPSQSRRDQLRGRLFSNHGVLCVDVVLSEWMPEKVNMSAHWALAGLGLDEVEDAWNRIRLQVTGFEPAMPTPLQEVTWPSDFATLPHAYSARFDPMSQGSEEDGFTLDLRFEESFRFGELYRFGVASTLVVTIESEELLNTREWVDRFLSPIRELAELVTGRSERILWSTFHKVDKADNGTEERTTGQLFAPGIEQEIRPAERVLDQQGLPLRPLFLVHEAPPLVRLVRQWHALKELHPAVALYGLARDVQLPVSVRFLLLAQAAESLDAIERREEEGTQDAAHATKRGEAMLALDSSSLPQEQLAFLRKNVTKKPFRALSSRLLRLSKRLPDSEQRTARWDDATRPLDAPLARLEREPQNLFERLAFARNALAHGAGELPSQPLRAAAEIFELILRCELLRLLGFSSEQLAGAANRVDDLSG